jgi:hypothetical protein
MTVEWGAQRTCLPRLRMTTSGRQDDAVTHFEPWDVLSFANDCSEAVSLRTLLYGLRRNTARMFRVPGVHKRGRMHAHEP